MSIDPALALIGLFLAYPLGVWAILRIVRMAKDEEDC